MGSTIVFFFFKKKNKEDSKLERKGRKKYDKNILYTVLKWLVEIRKVNKLINGKQ